MVSRCQPGVVLPPLLRFLPGRFAHILSFGVELLVESATEEETNHRHGERLLHFHCPRSSILLGAVSTPHSSLIPKRRPGRFTLRVVCA